MFCLCKTATGPSLPDLAAYCVCGRRLHLCSWQQKAAVARHDIALLPAHCPKIKLLTALLIDESTVDIQPATCKKDYRKQSWPFRILRRTTEQWRYKADAGRIQYGLSAGDLPAGLHMQSCLL